MSYIALFLVTLALLNGWLYLQQPSMIFIPQRDIAETPTAWGLEYEEVSLHTEDGVQLHGWYLPNPLSDKVILFFHGNAGNISHRGSSVAIFHQLGFKVFIFDYRGYGLSAGKPTEAGLYKDARAAWRFLVDTKGVKRENIVLFGRSLGGAMAAKLASEEKPSGLILESTFSSALEMAREILPLLSRVVYRRFEFNTLALAGRFNCPLLVLHSPEDEIIPYRMGQEIFEAAAQPKHFFQMQGMHNGGYLLSQPGYSRSLRRFIDSLDGEIHQIP
ncbi:MAG: alpha/beta hydrolase [Gammaproteobacteria bacterium]|nr:alpha/beta hydrolase [Gammaproteobacteria bacterium]